MRSELWENNSKSLLYSFHSHFWCVFGTTMHLKKFWNSPESFLFVHVVSCKLSLSLKVLILKQVLLSWTAVFQSIQLYPFKPQTMENMMETSSLQSLHRPTDIWCFNLQQYNLHRSRTSCKTVALDCTGLARGSSWSENCMWFLQLGLYSNACSHKYA